MKNCANIFRKSDIGEECNSIFRLMGCHQSLERKLIRLDTETLLKLPNGFHASSTIIRQDDIIDYISERSSSSVSSRDVILEPARQSTPSFKSSRPIPYEDDKFLANQTTIGVENISNAVWLRPKDLCQAPQLFVDGVSRSDVKQGNLGDCWLLSACAAVATKQEIIERVVDPTQPLYGPAYTGEVTFRFWSFGEIVEVSIDDRLPTIAGKLIFASCTHNQEFWLPLLEKAFAKLHGSYEALQGGHAASALVDLTGGIAERLSLQNCSFQELDIIFKHGALVTCAGRCSDAHAFGLVQGHAYTLTGMDLVTLTLGSEARLMRLRSPWADGVEWKGPWSDRSEEWNSVSEEEKIRLRVKAVDDGEFWMEYADFQNQFDELTIATVGPDFDRDGCSDSPKQSATIRGAWTETSAGGSRNNLELFKTNPQYLLTIPEAEQETPVSILVGLMQRPTVPLLPIAFFIYKTDTPTEALQSEFFLCTSAELTSGAFTDSLEVIARASLSPGNYVIIPATFQSNCQSDYLLRMYALQPFSLSPLIQRSQSPTHNDVRLCNDS